MSDNELGKELLPVNNFSSFGKDTRRVPKTFLRFQVHNLGHKHHILYCNAHLLSQDLPRKTLDKRFCQSACNQQGKYRLQQPIVVRRTSKELYLNRA